MNNYKLNGKKVDEATQNSVYCLSVPRKKSTKSESKRENKRKRKREKKGTGNGNKTRAKEKRNISDRFEFLYGVKIRCKRQHKLFHRWNFTYVT